MVVKKKVVSKSTIKSTKEVVEPQKESVWTPVDVIEEASKLINVTLIDMSPVDLLSVLAMAQAMLIQEMTIKSCTKILREELEK